MLVQILDAGRVAFTEVCGFGPGWFSLPLVVGGRPIIYDIPTVGAVSGNPRPDLDQGRCVHRITRYDCLSGVNLGSSRSRSSSGRLNGRYDCILVGRIFDLQRDLGAAL